MIIVCQNCRWVFCTPRNPEKCPKCRKNPYHVRGYYPPEEEEEEEQQQQREVKARK